MKRLDQMLLPPVARVLHRLGRGAARLRLLYVVAFVSVAAVLLTVVWQAGRKPVGDQTVGDVVRVGVVQGQSIPGYVQASRSELKSLLATPPSAGPVETYALVTLKAYLAPNRLTPLFGGVPVSQVYARVPLPATQTEIVRILASRVPTDVESGMEEVAGRKEADAANYQRLADELTRDGEQELRARYLDNGQVAASEATAYREHCSCVYAAVVRATPAVLDQVATRPEVRAVDPAPEVRRLDRAVFLPPLPEQDGVARPPADTVPTPEPSRADPTPTSEPASSPVDPVSNAPVPAEPTPTPSVPELSAVPSPTPY